MRSAWENDDERESEAGMLAEIFGMDGVIVLIVVLAVLFGSSQIPKIARSLGSAQNEFKKGLEEGKQQSGSDTDQKTT
jgi:sec-independent protein translocase protein TatA